MYCDTTPEKSCENAEKRLDISCKNYWCGGPEEGRVLLVCCQLAVMDHQTSWSFEASKWYGYMMKGMGVGANWNFQMQFRVHVYVCKRVTYNYMQTYTHTHIFWKNAGGCQKKSHNHRTCRSKIPTKKHTGCQWEKWHAHTDTYIHHTHKPPQLSLIHIWRCRRWP